MYIIIKRERGIVMNINYDEYVKYIEEIKTDEELEELEKSINSLDESPDKTSLLLKIAMKKVEIGYTPKIETSKPVEVVNDKAKLQKNLTIAIAVGSAAMIVLASAILLDKHDSKTMTEATIESTMDESANIMDTTSATEATSEVTAEVTEAATEATTVEPTTESSTTATTSSGTYAATNDVIDVVNTPLNPENYGNHVDMYKTLSNSEKETINMFSKVSGAMVNYAVENNITLSQSVEDYEDHLYMITAPFTVMASVAPASQAYDTNLYNDHVNDGIQPLHPEYFGADLDMFYDLSNVDRMFMNQECYVVQGFVQYANDQNISLSQAITEFQDYYFSVDQDTYYEQFSTIRDEKNGEDDMVDDYTDSTEGFTK